MANSETMPDWRESGHRPSAAKPRPSTAAAPDALGNPRPRRANEERGEGSISTSRLTRTRSVIAAMAAQRFRRCVVGAHSANSRSTKTITIWAQIEKRRESVSSEGKGFDFRAIVTIFTFSSRRYELNPECYKTVASQLLIRTTEPQSHGENREPAKAQTRSL